MYTNFYSTAIIHGQEKTLRWA